MCDAPRQSLNQLQQECAATLCASACTCSSAKFVQIRKLLADGAVPVAAFTNVSFDETPIWLRVYMYAWLEG